MRAGKAQKALFYKNNKSSSKQFHQKVCSNNQNNCFNRQHAE